MMISQQPKMIANFHNNTGECPIWHPNEQLWYWTDIPAGKLYTYNPETQEARLVYEGRPVGGMTIQQNGDLLLFRDKGNVVVFSDGTVSKTVIESIPELAQTRWNDVIADPKGRVFAGTISTPDLPGQLYRIELDGSYEVVLSDQGTPNGMGFSPDFRTFYYQDSRKATLYAFDYAQDSGVLSDQRILREARVSGDQGRGDGLCVDAQGFLWSARFEGGCVLKLSTEGVPLETIELPTTNITCLNFGGEDLQQLVVTSAGGSQKAPSEDLAGALFSLKLETKGKPEFRSCI